MRLLFSGRKSNPQGCSSCSREISAATTPPLIGSLPRLRAIAPFVIINECDSHRLGRSRHELVHLLLGHTGLSGLSPGTERSGSATRSLQSGCCPSQCSTNSSLIETKTSRSRRHGSVRRPGEEPSQTMVAYRLLRTDHIDQRTFDLMNSAFGAQWQRERDRRRAQSRESDRGPNYYVVRRQRVGQALLGFGQRMMDSGALSTTKAARVLGVKPTQVGKLLRP